MSTNLHSFCQQSCPDGDLKSLEVNYEMHEKLLVQHAEMPAAAPLFKMPCLMKLCCKM